MTAQQDYRYKAFISYSHADEKWAAWLHRGLETYRVPKRLVGNISPLGPVPARVAPVFRDREELASSTDLGADLREALDRSATQIVICSMASARSHWVNEEILAFKRLGRSSRIFCLIVDGEPFASLTPGREGEECLPPALHYVMGSEGELTDVRAELTAADARDVGEGKNSARIRLIAGVIGVGYETLRQSDLQRRNRRMAAVATLSTAATVAAIGLTTTAILARHEADRQRARAESEAETARQTSSFLIGLFKVSDPGEARGQSITAREILDAGVERIDEELTAQPTIQTRLLNTMGRVYTSLGLYDAAGGVLQTALERSRTAYNMASVESSVSLISLGNVKLRIGELDAAEALYRESIESLQGADASDSLAMADALSGLAETHYRRGETGAAIDRLAEALQIQEAARGSEHPRVIDTYQRLLRWREATG